MIRRTGRNVPLAQPIPREAPVGPRFGPHPGLDADPVAEQATDWTLMLNAVITVLGQAADAAPSNNPQADLATLRAAVRDGVTALRQLGAGQAPPRR